MPFRRVGRFRRRAQRRVAEGASMLSTEAANGGGEMTEVTPTCVIWSDPQRGQAAINAARSETANVVNSASDGGRDVGRRESEWHWTASWGGVPHRGIFAPSNAARGVSDGYVQDGQCPNCRT